MNKTIDINDLKRIQVELLDALDDYCNKLELTYYLAYGTLIGAIRHKGYIPWDDDVDVLMPRADYDFFIRAFNEKNYYPDISVLAYENDKDYYLSYAKLVRVNTVMKEETTSDYEIGVNIDIFPLDDLGDDYIKAEKIMRKAFRYNQILMLKNMTLNKNRKLYKNIVIAVGRTMTLLFTRGYLINKINSLHLDNKADGKYKGLLTGLYSKSECQILKAKWFAESTRASFEGKEYNVPAGYDEVLHAQYGDYMTPPPTNQQITHHAFKAWYK